MKEGSRSNHATVALLVVSAVILHAFVRDEPVATASYLSVLVCASVGAWIGAERAARGHRLVPRLIALGISLSASGDVLWSVLDLMGVSTDVSLADPPWFTSYLVLGAALWVVLTRSQSLGRSGQRASLDSLIDMATIVTVSVVVFWSLTVDAIVEDDSVTPFVRAVWAAYPIADAVLLALVVRVLMSRSARAAIDVTFAMGVCLWLVTDVAYLCAPEAGHALMSLMDAAWMVAPVLLARAAWRASEVRAEAPDPAAVGGWRGQLVIAVAPLFVPPALDIVSDLRGQPSDPLQLFLGTVALVALALVRTARLLRSEDRARRQLAVARDAALSASRAKSMFLANMSHELRTPLTTVLASAEMLEDTDVDDFQVELLTKMNRSGELLKSLVEGILDFSRIEAGQLKLSARPYDLHEIVGDATDAYLPRAARQGLRFESHVDPAVPHTVLGDRDRLFQVFTNLLDNALKFTHQGQVSLDVRPVTADAGVLAESEAVEVIVSDTGIGIPKDHLDLVFESFHQVDGSATRSYGGNGLGLSISKELVELMGGSITVHSQFGAGTTFVVRLPVTAPPVREPVALPVA